MCRPYVYEPGSAADWFKKDYGLHVVYDCATQALLSGEIELPAAEAEAIAEEGGDIVAGIARKAVTQ